MSEVVSNTSPLQHLFQLDVLHILPAMAGKIVVPPAVVEELAEGRTLGLSVPDPLAYEWVTVRIPASTPAILIGNKKLGRGEREVISLAAEIGATAILDDAMARRFAAQLNIPSMGIL